MRKWIAVTLAGAGTAATLALGIGSASAATKYTCTKTAHGKAVTATARTDRAEDALEAHGFTCAGD